MVSVAGIVLGDWWFAVVFPLEMRQGGRSECLDNPFISTYHWLQLTFWGQYLVTKGLQLCFLWICDREENNKIWYSNWLKCLRLGKPLFRLTIGCG